MALDLATTYGTAIDSTDPANYPQGKFKNETTPGVTKDGTPYERAWVNDMLGFHQRLLLEAGVTPSGVADTVQASDYWDALQAIYGTYATLDISGTAASETNYAITLDASRTRGGFSVASNALSFPAAGTYEVSCSLIVTSSEAVTNPLTATQYVVFSGAATGYNVAAMRGTRYDTSSEFTLTAPPRVVVIDDPLTETIAVRNDIAAQSFTVTALQGANYLTVRRLK
jgi:hypothetical protein